MRQISKNLGKTKIAKVLLQNAPCLTMPFLQRSKSRQVVLLDSGEEVLLVLNRGGVMRGGDILVDDQGQFIIVQAVPEQVLRVTASNFSLLMRAAYHLGNRHIPVEIQTDYLQLEYDPVLSDMLKKLGVHVTLQEYPFEPEHGAYGKGHKHGHDETFEQDYALAQSAYHDHAHSHLKNHPHEH